MADPPEPNPNCKTAAPDARALRALRAAASLRENLRKRKQQSRARTETPPPAEPIEDASRCR